MHPRISIRGSVRPSDRWSVGPLVSRFFQILEIDKSEKSNTCKSDRIWQIWQISLSNSMLVSYFRRIFVRTNLLFLWTDLKGYSVDLWLMAGYVLLFGVFQAACSVSLALMPLLKTVESWIRPCTAGGWWWKLYSLSPPSHHVVIIRLQDISQYNI